MTRYDPCHNCIKFAICNSFYQKTAGHKADNTEWKNKVLLWIANYRCSVLKDFFLNNTDCLVFEDYSNIIMGKKEVISLGKNETIIELYNPFIVKT